MAEMDIDVVDVVGEDRFVREGCRLFPQAIRARSVSHMVNEVINRLGSNRLRRLRIIGLHGVADSRLTMDPGRLLTMDGSGKVKDAAILSLLADRFAADGRVELHGCDVVRGYEGKMLLAELCELWRVRVHDGLAAEEPRLEQIACMAAAAPVMAWD